MVVGILARRFAGRCLVALGVALACGILVGSAGAVASRSVHASGQIGFYPDIGNAVNTQTPVVKPAQLFVTEDGSVVLEHLRWQGWGSSVAHGTGVLSVSNCTPSCAAGKRTTSSAQLTLSKPGSVLGHSVYKCFQLTAPSHPQSNEYACLGPAGTLTAYNNVPTPSKPVGWIIHVIAGTGVKGSKLPHKAVKAELNYPTGIGVDGKGNVYVLDPGNFEVLKISPSGTITRVAGNASHTGGQISDFNQTGRATSLGLGTAQDLAVDSRGDLFITTNNMVREVTSKGIIKTVAGTLFKTGFAGDGGPATKAVFNNADGIAVDGKGDIYVSDYENNRIRKVGTNGIITTIAGDGKAGFSGDGGPATKAELKHPGALAVDLHGNVYVCDTDNYRLRKITPAGIISTIAGNPKDTRNVPPPSGIAKKLALNICGGVAVDNKGNIFVTGALIVQEITGKMISIIAGRLEFPEPPLDYGGPALKALLGAPTGIAVGPKGNVYFTDNFKQRVFKLTR